MYIYVDIKQQLQDPTSDLGSIKSTKNAVLGKACRNLFLQSGKTHTMELPSPVHLFLLQGLQHNIKWFSERFCRSFLTVVTEGIILKCCHSLHVCSLTRSVHVFIKTKNSAVTMTDKSYQSSRSSASIDQHFRSRRIAFLHWNRSAPRHSSAPIQLETSPWSQFLIFLCSHYLMSAGISIFTWASTSSLNNSTTGFFYSPPTLHCHLSLE